MAAKNTGRNFPLQSLSVLHWTAYEVMCVWTITWSQNNFPFCSCHQKLLFFSSFTLGVRFILKQLVHFLPLKISRLVTIGEKEWKFSFALKSRPVNNDSRWHNYWCIHRSAQLLDSHAWPLSFVKVWKKGQQKLTTSLAVFLQNELNSDVARFTNHESNLSCNN